jgi:hypothetical protein
MTYNLQDEWLYDLQQNREARTKSDFDRDWLIFAAKYHGKEPVVRIAEAAGLSRSQVHRIINEVEDAAKWAIESQIVSNRPEAIERAWGKKSWDDFYEVPEGTLTENGSE